MVAVRPPLSGRFIGIAVEQYQNWPEWSRLWPHLGLTYIGTAAKQCDYEVVLHDEFIEGYAPLETLIQEGDIVGLSLVITGIERGIEIARKCKELGASYVIAGNDAAIFGARKLLALPGKPIDAVATSNSVVAVRQLLNRVRKTPIEELRILHVATNADDAPLLSNSPESVRWQKDNFDTRDFFMIPDLSLYGGWERVWTAYRNQFGHKHTNGASVKNAIALLSHGCGRAAAGHVCEFCSIGGVANFYTPTIRYLERTLRTYLDFGIDTFFNVADSSLENASLASALKQLGSVPSLVMYGRAAVITEKHLERWHDVASERILINCGMESGDERILQSGVNKSERKKGSRLEENRNALKAILAAGDKFHLHASAIFGSPGETRESCMRTLELIDEVIDVLGPTQQLDIFETDFWWVNEGAPCAQILTDYGYAQKLAQSVGKDISYADWKRDLLPHASAITLTGHCQEAWYRHFTHITPDIAREFIEAVNGRTASVKGIVNSRNFNFLPG